MEELRSYLIKNNIDVGPQHYKNTASILSFEDFYKNCSIADRVSKIYCSCLPILDLIRET